MSLLDNTDTICATATPPGTGGLAVIRVSGPGAYEVTRKLCAFLPKQPESHRSYYGFIKTINDSLSIDEVIVACFDEGRSFTGEQTAEISCHGSRIITENILEELIKAGARLAKPGEFTFRAFMSGRIDLVQAESVLSLIESQSKPAARAALRQLSGELSARIKSIDETIIWALAHVEASIDFSTEDIEVVNWSDLERRLFLAVNQVDELLAGFEKGRVISEGLRVAIVGLPNVGKSSLLNVLMEEDRAIVTDEPGTTRDLVEGRMTLGGYPVMLFDTAGIRETTQKAEKIGIKRSLELAESADVVIHVAAVDYPDSAAVLASARAGKTLWAINKMDVLAGEDLPVWVKELEEARGPELFFLSTETKEGVDTLKSALKALAQELGDINDGVVFRVRQAEGLQKIQEGLNAAIEAVKAGMSPDLVSSELMVAARALSEILGREFNEQIIDRIFKEFCLGK